MKRKLNEHSLRMLSNMEEECRDFGALVTLFDLSEGLSQHFDMIEEEHPLTGIASVLSRMHFLGIDFRMGRYLEKKGGD